MLLEGIDINNIFLCRIKQHIDNAVSDILMVMPWVIYIMVIK